MQTFIDKPKQVKVSISYQRNEAPKVMKMEDELMYYFGYNRSQLHKSLVRDAYKKYRML
tara:strand:- start:323 stop:499 length:177 start_codon:yes stop_codon:yes gene_type:complete